MNDETLVRTVKNSLMIAGHEMGPVGDHWPAIHAISKGVEEEFHQLHINEAVVGELEFHMASAIRLIEEMAEGCSDPQGKKEIADYAKEMWSQFYALMEPASEKLKPTVQDILAEDDPSCRNTRAAIKIIKDMGGRV